MQVTKWTEYGIILLQRLASDAVTLEDGSKAPMNVRALAVPESIPVDFAEQVMLKLRAGGVVASKRGRLGGYILAIAPAALSIATVFRAVEPDALTVDDTTDARVRPTFQAMQDAIYSALGNRTLADVMPQR